MKVIRMTFPKYVIEYKGEISRLIYRTYWAIEDIAAVYLHDDNRPDDFRKHVNYQAENIYYAQTAQNTIRDIMVWEAMWEEVQNSVSSLRNTKKLKENNKCSENKKPEQSN